MPIMGTGIRKQVPANASCEKGKSSELMNGHIVEIRGLMRTQNVREEEKERNH
ncbi:hypothetical protein M6B38_250245 [Iris pallida]|uniref:Uncharacterized protein n=1 Tax=Iris pallida TaxID=29817 RepID=A0AAX6IKJ8_IRIPA|nr:hypothetical protein M6B38_250245 [Iris pallida]